MIDAYAGRLPDPVLNFGGRPMNAFSLALTATCFTFLCTAAGAAFVFVVGHSRKKTVVQVSLGFAAGIMLAASVFGLLIPSIDGARAAGGGLVPPAGGFVLGVLLLMLMNRLVPHLHTDADEPEGVRSGLGRQSLLFLAITIHNVPEGMSLGVLAAAAGGSVPEGMGALLALAIGIGIQNIPEGTAVSVPLFAAGGTRKKSFLLGVLSGAVEPAGALLVVCFQDFVVALLPWFLSFSAGAMLYVVVEELIPESHAMAGGESDWATVSVLVGFLVMMVLDVALG